MLRLLWDERRIVLTDPDQEQLWRYFYRRGGMGKLEFLETWRRCRLQRFAPGEALLTAATARRTFLVLIEGTARYTVKPLPGTHSAKFGLGSSSVQHSGASFEKGLLNVLGVHAH